MTISIADVMAAVDVLDQFTEEIDSLTVMQSVHFTIAVGELQKRVKLAQELLKTKTLNLIEKQPVVVDGTVYARKPVKKWRPNQHKIQVAVASKAIYDPQTGERVDDPLVSAANAVSIMVKLFVAPSQMPKQEGLAALGLTNRDVAERVTTGHDLKTIGLEPDDE